MACAAVLLPFNQAEAKFGGLTAGKSFTLKVDEVISVKQVGLGGANTKAPIPAGVPKFKKGQKIKFKIGAGGKLTAKGLSIPFKSDAGNANVYFFVSTGASNKAMTGTIYRDTKNKPTGGSLNFVLTKYAGFNSSVNTVTYTLEK